MTPGDIKSLRDRLGLSQAAFASRYALPLRTLEGWESGREISYGYLMLLHLIEIMPNQVANALGAPSRGLAQTKE